MAWSFACLQCPLRAAGRELPGVPVLSRPPGAKPSSATWLNFLLRGSYALLRLAKLPKLAQTGLCSEQRHRNSAARPSQQFCDFRFRIVMNESQDQNLNRSRRQCWNCLKQTFKDSFIRLHTPSVRSALEKVRICKRQTAFPGSDCVERKVDRRPVEIPFRVLENWAVPPAESTARRLSAAHLPHLPGNPL